MLYGCILCGYSSLWFIALYNPPFSLPKKHPESTETSVVKLTREMWCEHSPWIHHNIHNAGPLGSWQFLQLLSNIQADLGLSLVDPVNIFLRQKKS